MLGLSRKPGEGVQIGGDIRVYVRQCRSGRVHLSIDAPRDILIRRLDEKLPESHTETIDDTS